MDTAKIVVGVDGSAPSLAALRWAALEAQRRRVELEVILAYHWRMPGVRLAASPELAQSVQDLAESVADAAVAEARTVAPRARVRGVAVDGEPGPVLVRAGEDAGMIVVGSRGRGGFASLLAGSVSVQVATQATCPVTVVRGRDDDDVGAVVVGVDGSESADFATGIAFEEAARRSCALVAVQAYTVSMPPWTMGPPPVEYNPDEARANVRTALIGHLAGWRDKYPDVPVDHVVGTGSAGTVLINWSRRAQLIVVGTRGHSPTACLLLGSVGLQLIHHSDCPVLIARARG
jgi:nucleotide-binding universal stress UspA family protein